MHLFFRDKKPDYEKVHETVSQGYGHPHPEKTLGYAGAFLFTLPDVFVSDAVELLLSESPEHPEGLWELLQRFKHEDYGEISEEDEYNNIESRYIGGYSSWMTACYRTEFGIIRYESLYDAAILFLSGEDISFFRDEQEARRQRGAEEFAKKMERLRHA